MTSENQGELPLSVEKPIAAQSNLPSSNLLFSPDRLTEEEKRIYLQVMDRNWEDQPLFIDNLEHIGDAAKAIALGRPLIVLAPFGNIYGLFGHPAKEVVEAINVAKGRPAEQVGSITTTQENILNMFDLDRL